jgi:hypothetical protein
MGWTNSPQYLKGIQKIRAMSPEKKAVTQTLVNELGGIYAGADMQKQLQAMRIASDVKRQDRHADISERKFDLSSTLRQGEFDLAEDAYKNNKSDMRTAENLGWGNVALSGLTGYANMRHKKKQSKTLADIATSLYGRK